VVTAGRRMGGTTPRAQSKDREDEETPERDERRKRAVERLRLAVATGDYDGLLDPALWRLLDAAAETAGFGREIGALRFAMARLLAEEEDPRQLATHLSRVATTIVRATQARSPVAPAEDTVRAALLAGLGDLADRFGDVERPDDDEETELTREDEP